MSPASPNEPGPVRLGMVISGELDADGIADLCRRLRDRLIDVSANGGAPTVDCELALRGAPNLTTIEALARLQLTAHRGGASITFRCRDGDLVELVQLVGLHEIVDVTTPATEDRETTAKTQARADPEG